MRAIVKVVMIAAVGLFFTACSGGKNNWGIDNGMIPQCSGEKRDSFSALLVPDGSKIRAIKPGTNLRVWHYSNGDKKVCVLSGKAIVEGNK